MTRLAACLLTVGVGWCSVTTRAESRGESSAETAPSAELSGRWLVLQVSTAATRVPILGSVETVTRSVALHKLEHVGDRLFGPGILCDLQSKTTPAVVRTEYPPALIQNLPQPRLDGRLVSKEGTLFFHQPRETIVIGADLDDLEREPLPADPADARVVDQDADGQPGVTVTVRGFVSGDVFVTQRNSSEFWGERNETGFTGALRFATEQNILGATSSRLTTPSPAVPVLSKSYVRMIQLAEHATCQQARQAAQTVGR